MKVNFVYTGVMKSHHLILYWNLYHSPVKRISFLKAAIKFTEIRQCKSCGNISAETIMTTAAMNKMPTAILLMTVRMKHID